MMRNAKMRATVRILCVVYTPCTSQKLQYLERKFVKVFKYKCDLYRNVFLSQIKIRIPSVCLFVFFVIVVVVVLFYEKGEEKGNVFKTGSSRLGGNLQRSGDWVLSGRELILNSDTPFCPKHVLHSYTSQHTFKDNFSSWYCLVSFSWLHQWICLHLPKSPAQVAQLPKMLLICCQFCSVDLFQQSNQAFFVADLLTLHLMEDEFAGNSIDVSSPLQHLRYRL